MGNGQDRVRVDVQEEFLRVYHAVLPVGYFWRGLHLLMLQTWYGRRSRQNKVVPPTDRFLVFRVVHLHWVER